jgi:hypothetical protein
MPWGEVRISCSECGSEECGFLDVSSDITSPNQSVKYLLIDTDKSRIWLHRQWFHCYKDDCRNIMCKTCYARCKDSQKSEIRASDEAGVLCAECDHEQESNKASKTDD